MLSEILYITNKEERNTRRKREKAMKQQLKQIEKNVVELLQKIAAMQTGPTCPVLRDGKSKQ